MANRYTKACGDEESSKEGESTTMRTGSMMGSLEMGTLRGLALSTSRDAHSLGSSRMGRRKEKEPCTASRSLFQGCGRTMCS